MTGKDAAAHIASSPEPRIGRTIVSLGIANVALYVVYMGVLQLLLPHQISLLDPTNKVSLFGLVTGVAAIAATVANPIAGALSDRTRTRIGRRSPWLIGVALAAIPVMAGLGAMQTIIGVTLGWCLLQVVMNGFQASLTAILPERVPVARRGAASAIFGLGVPFGIIFGTLIAQQFLHNLPLAYAMLGIVFAIVAFAFVALNPEATSRGWPDLPRPSMAGFFSSLSDSDFRWTFISRFLINLTYCATTTFHFFLLQDFVTLRPGQTPEQALVLVNAAGMGSMIAATLISGWVSDLAKRRKVFVSGAAFFLAFSPLTLIFFPTFEGMLAFAVCNGLGMGSYLAVDTVLVTQVLPDDKNQGRDLGIFNIASAGPQIMGPFVASMFVAHLGGYASMLLYGAVMAAISAFTILQVRNVR
jgi:MFS family permease